MLNLLFKGNEIILNNKLKMKFCNKAFVENEKDIDSSREAKCEYPTNNNFGEIKNLSYSNNLYCKFKLKKNRKIAVPKKNKSEKMITPPMAPKNMTQYLTKLRENTYENPKENNFVQSFSNENYNYKKRLYSTADNSPLSFTNSSEGTFAEEKNTENSKNWKNEPENSNTNPIQEVLKKKNQKNEQEEENSKEEKNEITNFLEKDYIYNNSFSNINYENSIEEISENENDDDAFSGNEFFMGSTMKSIVESITKSKSKIFSNLLVLDGTKPQLKNDPYDEEAKEQVQPQLREPVEIAKNPQMKLRISDFFPQIEQNAMENPTNDYLYSSSENNEDSDIFPFQENFLTNEDQNSMEVSDKSTTISVLSKPFLYIESSVSVENETIYENEVSSNNEKEENKIFLLGKKRRKNKNGEFKGSKKNKPFSVFRTF